MLELDFSQRLGDLNLNVRADLPAQGITAIFGLSGAGKTSLINAVGGLTHLQQGRIVLNGRTLVDTDRGLCLPPEKRRFGYVFQDARLFPHYRVRGNLQYGMAAGMRKQFDSIVELLGIGPLLNRLPLTLSGGEKQRVAIGRALLTAPELLLMDEPLASLDLPRKRELLPYLERLAQDVNIPILYVSHSMDEIMLWRQEPAQLLMLDEPTNHLDLASSLAIERALVDFPGAMLVVSHDEAFLQALKLTHRLQWQEGKWQLQVW